MSCGACSPAVVPWSPDGRQITTKDGVLIRFDPTHRDAFGRFRVSTPTTLFSSKQVFDNESERYKESVNNGSAVYDNTRSATILTANGGLAGNFAKRRTKRFVAYQPGKSQLIYYTFDWRAHVTGHRVRSGPNFGGNGFRHERRADGTLYVSKLSTVPGNGDTEVPQSQWNIDTMDGTGDASNPSGILLRSEFSQIGFVDFEWLGVGSAVMGFVINRVLYPVHQFDNANQKNGVYMRTPNLPLLWEVENVDGVAGSHSIDQICCGFLSEGGQEVLGITRPANNGTTGVSIANSELRAVISIRLATSHLQSSVLQRAVSIIDSTSGNGHWKLLLNPTFDGTAAAPVWTSIGGTGVEKDVTRTGANGIITAVGSEIAADYWSNNTRVSFSELGERPIIGTSDFDATTSDVLVLAAQTLSGGGGTAYGNIRFTQLD